VIGPYLTPYSADYNLSAHAGIRERIGLSRGLTARGSKALGVLPLTKLVFCGVGGIESEDMAASIARLPLLTHLQLRSCQGVDDLCLAKVTKATRTLEVLALKDLRGISDKGLSQALRRSQALASLQLELCARVDNEALHSIAKYCGIRLQSLSLARCSTDMSDEGLEAVAGACSSLLRLNLSGCHRLTKIGLNAICKGCPRLKELCLERCSALHEGDLAPIAGLIHLEQLDLSGCVAVDDAFIDAVVVTHPCLRRLRLRGCVNLRDQGLGLLAGMGSLRDLDLDGSSMTEDGIKSLINAAQGRGLNVSLNGVITPNDRPPMEAYPSQMAAFDAGPENTCQMPPAEDFGTHDQ